VNKVLLILVAVVLALSVGLVGCSCAPAEPPEADTIVIGMSRSLTGELKDRHVLEFGAIYPIYIEILNNAGGITVDGTSFNVETKVLNDNSSTAQMIANTNALIADIGTGEVDFLFGAVGRDMIALQAPIANTASVVLMTFEGSATTMKNTPVELPSYPYVFVNSSFADWYQMPVLATMLAEAHFNWCGAHNATAYIAYIDEAYGYEYRDEAEAAFQAAGINVCKKVPITHATVYTDLTTEAKTAGPGGTKCHIFCGFTYPVNGTFALAQAANATGYDADAFILGLGANFGVYPIVMACSLADGVVSFGVANNKTVVRVGTPSMSMTTFFNTTMGGMNASTDFWEPPLFWAAMEMWQEAVENAGQVLGGNFTIDQDDFRDYLAQNKFDTVLGQTWYVGTVNGGTTWDTWPVPDPSGALMNYLCHTGEIIQWQPYGAYGLYPEVVGNSTIEVDLPNYDATAAFIYPKPDWHG
jgi:ABC-type branched-subunit amino acid transport system substrate-binding protein